MTDLCSIEGCTRKRKYVKTGWCQTHYHRYWRTGDPMTVKMERGASGDRTRSWQGDAITYRTAHTRVTQRRGKACSYTCMCGKQARHWSYDHTDPNHQKQVFMWKGKPITCFYSTDVMKYQALCRGCHVKRDRYDKAAR